MDRIYVMQLVRSFQVGQISRRTFLRRASVAAGGMAAANLLLAACLPVTREGAVRPVTEATPTGEGVGTPETNMTTEEGLIVERVEYAGPDGEMLPGYLARPEGDGPHPGVIVLQEWWGIDEHIKDVTRRVAQAGYVALAPDLYHGQVATEPDEARKLVMELDMPAAVEEIGRGRLFAGPGVRFRRPGRHYGLLHGRRPGAAGGAERCGHRAVCGSHSVLRVAADARAGRHGDDADPGVVRGGRRGHPGSGRQGHAGCADGGRGGELVYDLRGGAARVFQRHARELPAGGGGGCMGAGAGVVGEVFVVLSLDW